MKCYLSGIVALGILAASAPGDVVISEILYHPSSEDSREEFIELYNSASSNIVLTGWSISEGVRFVFPTVTIGPTSYLAVAADTNVFKALHPGITAVVGNWTGALANDGETIELLDRAGLRADQVSYADQGDWGQRKRGWLDHGHRGWSWSADHDGGGKSIEWVNPALPNDFGQNWAASSAYDGSPGAVNGARATNIAPMIVEVRQVPAIPRSDEPVTVLARIIDERTNGLAVSLKYRAEGGSNFTSLAMTDDGARYDGLSGDGIYAAAIPALPNGTVVEFYLVATDATGRSRSWPAPVESNPQILGRWLLDEGAGLTAGDSSGRRVNGLLTNGAAFTAGGVRGGAVSLDGTNDFILLENRVTPEPPLGAETFTLALWFKRLGSGLTTSTGTDGINAEPLLTKGRTESNYDFKDVNWFLGLKASGTGVVLVADFEEHVTSLQPSLNHPVTGQTAIANGTWHHAALTYDGFTLTLFLDGQPDATLAVTSTPNYASIQPAAVGTSLNSLKSRDGAFKGAVDEVMVLRDALSADALRFMMTNGVPPTNSPQQACNLLYQVDDDADPKGTAGYRLIMKESERAELAALGADPYESLSDAQMNGTFVSSDGSGTKLRYTVGIRNRGNGSRTANPNNHRVNFTTDAKWNGRESLNLNSRFPYVQVAGSLLCRRAGLQTATALPAGVRVNGEDLSYPGAHMYGSYAELEAVNADFAAAHFRDDSGGNLYQCTRIVGNGATLDYAGSDAAEYRLNYSKKTNRSEDDWSDLIALTWALSTNTPDSVYTQTVEAVVNVSEWFRYLALMTLFDNRETSLNTGDGDDYYLYRGVADPRFVLIPHDLDTILSEGYEMGSITNPLLEFCHLPALDRLVKRPEYAPLYYAHLRDLARTVFTRAEMDRLLDPLLDYVPADALEILKAFATNRCAWVLAQIPTNLTVFCDLPRSNDWYWTSDDHLSLRGNADPEGTHHIEANGITANWTPWEMTWSATGIPLLPGINRVSVRAFDRDGRLIEQHALDVWREGAIGTIPPPYVSSNTLWSVAAGPWIVTGEVYVTTESTLTIEPGATVLFEPGSHLGVGGVLIANGTPDARIRLGYRPGGTNDWLGVRFYNESQTSRLAHVDFDCASPGTANIKVWRSNLLLNDVTWSSPTGYILNIYSSSVHILNCAFPVVTGGDAITGQLIPSNGFVIIESNVFQYVHGYNDVIDFTGGKRPGPIIQILGNTFLGGDDDAADLDGTDAHIEGNYFANFHNVHNEESTVNAISTGTDGGNSAEIVAVRNIFINNDHAALIKDGSFLIFENNTVVNCGTSAINFDEPERPVNPGLGARIKGCIFEDCALVFENVYDHDPVEGTVQLTVDQSLLPSNLCSYGNGNRSGDPRFQEPGVDFRLKAGSPACGTGPMGLDMGAMVPAGAAIAGEPETPTRVTGARLEVGGPGISEYRWRLNGGAWSGALPVTNPIILNGLTASVYQIEAIGKNSAAVWQSSNAPAVSESWTVAPSLTRLVINEVLAENMTASNHAGSYPDLIELYNAGSATFNLSGLQISDDPSISNKYVFPSGTTILPGRFLVLYADTNSALPGLHLGFSLKKGGEGVYLRNSAAGGGALIDSVVFGIQAPDLSIGRLRDGTWGLCQPTFGQTNVAAALGDPTRLRINEWLTDGSGFFMDDYVELLNLDENPVALADLFLADNPGIPSDRSKINPLSYVSGHGHAALVADGHPEKGADHVDFELAAEQGCLALFAPDRSLIDIVFYGPQQRDTSEGRSPDGNSLYSIFDQPNPGAGNPAGTNLILETVMFSAMTSVWHYNQSGIQPPTNWTSVAFDDSAWPTGRAAFAAETDPLPVPTNTALTLGKRTYYFRQTFVVDGLPTESDAELLVAVDDGVVVYLNGSEVRRVGMPDGPISYTNQASRGVGNAKIEGPFLIPGNQLLPGTNLLAAEVHQQYDGSSDVVFGMSLQGEVLKSRSARINEILAFNTAVQGPGGSYPDWIELYNPIPYPIQVGSLGLTDDLAIPYKWVFPDTATVPPNGYLRIWCDSSQPASASNTGFGFDWEGDGVFLFDTESHGGGMLDGVTFGLQVADLSIGRLPDGHGTWGLTTPTPLSSNISAAVNDASCLKINEWMASPSSGEDWFECYNPGAFPVDVSGLHLTDDLLDWDKNRLPLRSYLGCGPQAYKKFMADENLELGAHHVVFKLSGKGESLGLFSKYLIPIDSIVFGPQSTGISQGRLPNGTGPIVNFPGTASPEAANYAADSDTDGMPDPWEQAYGFNPASNADAADDADGDGFDNATEYFMGTDPQNEFSGLEMDRPAITGNQVWVSFDAVAGKTYTLWGCHPATTNWQPISAIGPVPRSGATPYALEVSASQRWYRVSTP